MENDVVVTQTPFDACVYKTPETQFAQAGITLSGNVDYSICSVAETVSINSKAFENATSALSVEFNENFVASVVEICGNAAPDIAGINLAYCETQLPSHLQITREGGANEPYTTGFTVPIESIDDSPYVVLDHGPYWGFLNNDRPEGLDEYLRVPLADFVKAVEAATLTMDEANMRDVIQSQLVDPMPPEAQKYMQTANTTAAGVGISLLLVVIAVSFIPYIISRAKDSAAGAWHSFRSGKGE
ncbi:MAG TPA: hypothetical protein PLV59_02300 [Candidatus Dojkabacteria bacterium]|nr:hypothetical protein [Candidatus Dojkabacteria bacterium]